MRQNLTKALELIFGHEGGYVNAKTDRGGPTKFGITAQTLGAYRHLGRPATIAEVKSLTLDQAAEILQAGYAKPIYFDGLPAGLDYAMLDYAVNSGPSQANKSLQRVLGVNQDGTMGPNTLAAIRKISSRELITKLCEERMRFLRTLGGSQGFKPNGRGWTIRVTGKDPKGAFKPQPGVLGNALAMSGAPAGSPMLALTATDMPQEVEAQSLTPASPSNKKVSSTTQGRGLITTMLGAGATQIDQAKESIVALTGHGSFVDTIFTVLTVGGVTLTIAGVVWTAYGIIKGISSGAASGNHAAPVT